jgi:hypothetical protein
MRNPEFITFTGADDRTDVDGMRALSARYPIEWGVLFSPHRQGQDNRYPGGEAQSRLAWSGLRLAAHLCGSHARSIMAGEELHVPVDLGIFKRIQINHTEPSVSAINAFRAGWGPRCIVQTRGLTFPRNTSVDWLFDTSGGRGKEPEAIPPYPGRLVGYAGGIGPDNVRSVIERIAATGPYWIDMESKVRSDDWFDLSLCEQVCRAVYS